MTTTTPRIALTLCLASLVAACSGGARTSGPVGPAGGTVTTPSGISLKIPAGAVAQAVEVRIVEDVPGEGELHRIHVEPADLKLGVPGTLSFKVEDGNVRVNEVEHLASGESLHGLAKSRHDASGEVEVEIEHGGEIEVEHGATCATACDAGLVCDDGACKADDDGVDDPATHDVGDDNGTDPLPHP